jgi:UDP-3-O-[3-hydroxymyristoyl] glucosamine N-acyltransferase
LNVVVSGAGTVPNLVETEIGFVQDKAYADALEKVASGVVFTTPELSANCASGLTVVKTNSPYKDFVAAVSALYGDVNRTQYLQAANNKPSTQGQHCIIAPSASFGDGVELGDNVVIGPNSFVGACVQIGDGTIIGDSVTVFAAIIGTDCRIHSGVRLGHEGFGFIPTGEKPIKIPQLGRVIVHDGVEIGTNSCIDRGMLDDTIIGANTKIDNMVQIAHNVQIGQNCQISAQTGIAGSSHIGDNVLLGGRVGVVNKAKVGNKASVMACSLVTKDVPSGVSVAGNPAIDVKMWRRQVAQSRKAARGQS